MKDLENFQNDINNCSRCGLCQAVCPIFQETKNDCTAPKGKFTMLNKLITSGENPTNELINYMKTCLNCKRCTDFCPSKIDIVKVNSAFNKGYLNFFIPSINCVEKILAIISIFLKLYRFLKIDKIANRCFGFLAKCGKIGKSILLLNSLISEEIKPKKMGNLENPKYRILFFQGCVNKYINPSQKNALLQFMEANNITVEVGDFTCCGRIYYLTGKMNEYKKIVERNSKIINANDYDYIVFDCATCFDTVCDYPDIDKSKLIMAEDFLDKTDIKITSDESATYFKPCLKKNFPKYIDKVGLKKYDNNKGCCGGSLPFGIFNKNLSEKLSENTAKELIKMDTNFIITSCSLCKFGLYKGLINLNYNKKILSTMEFLLK